MSRVAVDSMPLASAKSAEADRGLVAATLFAAACGVALRVAVAPQFDGLDDLGYFGAVQRVHEGVSLDGLYGLFRTRVGMAYPLGWLMRAGWLEAHQFWVLTILAECLTFISLVVVTRALTGGFRAGLAAVVLYAAYPLAVQQSAMYFPTAFQVAAIAGAFALLVVAERGLISPSARIGAGLAAGVLVGLGYLAKEDVAIVVPAMVLASLVTGFPRRSTMAALCVGAAAIFAAECVTYALDGKHFLFRLVSTSGQGEAPTIQLHMAQIWNWDAYLRTLWLMPVQVGLLWWLLIPSMWWVFRRGSAAVRFAAIVLLITAAYLQFGSGSLSAYLPLPKSPRYTSLLTPFVIVIVALWLMERVEQTRRAALALVVVTLAALPCIVYLHISSGERSRNTLAVIPVLREVAPQHLYTDYYGARMLRLLAPRIPKVSVWYHARFDINQVVVQSEPESSTDAYVLLDRQSSKIYTSSYEMTMPREIAEPPSEWQLVWTGRAYADGTMTRRLLEAVRTAAGWLPAGNPLTARITRNVNDMIDGDQAMLYRLPGRTSQTREIPPGASSPH